MLPSDDIKQLLAQIRDLQQEHLAEYRQVTQRSLELQERAVLRQEQFAKLYRRVLAVGAALLLGLIALAVYTARGSFR